MGSKQLEPWQEAREEGRLEKRLAKRGGMPRELTQAVRDALERRDRYAWYYEVEDEPAVLEATLTGLTDAKRRKLIERLLPHLADAVEGTWHALARRPFQTGTNRRPFRCPRSEGDLAIRRGRWLLRMCVLLGDYDRDVAWIAEWASQLSGWTNATELGWLLAGALDAGGPQSDEVFEILRATASGEHETAKMGRHVTQALMACSRPDAWEFNENLLLAAQRQEGLRQVILEAVDESHPEAFRRMLRLILDENLARFSSVVRAFDVWFGFQWDGSSRMKVNDVLQTVLGFLDDPATRAAALEQDDAEVAYLALWAMAFNDVETVVEPAARMLEDASVEKRFIATHLLVQSWWKPARLPLVASLGDVDLRVAVRALHAFQQNMTHTVDTESLFSALEALLARAGKKRSNPLGSLVWPWWDLTLERPQVAAAMVANRGTLPAERVLRYVSDLDPDGREAYVRNLAGLPGRWSSEPKNPKRLEGDEREAVLELVGDPSGAVRGVAFAALEATPIESDEVERYRSLLGRKAGDLRHCIIARLRALPDAAYVAMAERLLREKSASRRLAGLELLRDAVEADRDADRAMSLASAYRDENTELSAEERTQLAAIFERESETSGGESSVALGLISLDDLPDWQEPSPCTIELETEASRRCIESLTELILEHAECEIELKSGERKMFLDSYAPLPQPYDWKDEEEPESNLPFADTWKRWESSRGDDLRDADGLELIRAIAIPFVGFTERSKACRRLTETGGTNAGIGRLNLVLAWSLRWSRPVGAARFCVDAGRNIVASLTDEDLEAMRSTRNVTWRRAGAPVKPHEAKLDGLEVWRRRLQTAWLYDPAEDLDEVRWLDYGLLRWIEAQSAATHRIRTGRDSFFRIYRSGRLGSHGEAEFIDHLVGRCSDVLSGHWLGALSHRKPDEDIADLPELIDVVERCRRRIVEVECRRGDLPTEASRLVGSLRYAGGLETVTKAMTSLGKTPFSRSRSWSDTDVSRKDTLSKLVARSGPRKEDTPAAFAQWAVSAKVRETRLVELAAYAPQWVAHVNAVLEWPGLESAVWWMSAHTKDSNWRLWDLRETWEAQVSERTPLTPSELAEGAVDVDWFREAHETLGAERFAKLHKAAKYASSSGGHKRAQLFASAMTGDVSIEELVARIDDKRHQDSVRALGLVPLPSGSNRKSDLLARYQRLQDFKRESRKFGSQRQQTEGRAVEIGLENLARTAGYKDVLRFQWAMEREAVADLVDGPVSCTKDDFVMQLSIDDEGKPALSMHKTGSKGDRSLRALPAKWKKDPDIVEMKGRMKELRRQASRVKGALEEAMIRGDVFEGSELQELLRHPILAPSLERLVFIGEDIAGYLVEGAKALRDASGKLEPVRKNEPLRIAHAYDLLESGEWSAWQTECFRAERIQPFKQVFRELYPLTANEREDAKRESRRYAGHQVQPRQALKLLGTRGWVVQPEEGVSKTFHHVGLAARLMFDEAFYSPADVEGLTLESVVFTEKADWKALDLESIPPRLFSETMRDLDLVVSVAHRGGVDPEATASTIEMRAALVRETCRLLRLDNVETKGHHVIVRGSLATYGIHLGSAATRVLDGNALVIVAVHSQHRGRLFLPFADDDPRTAEVMSKVLLLARDETIRDPNILDQIRG